MNLIKSIYITPKGFYIAGLAAVMFCFGLLFPPSIIAGKIVLALLLIGILGDTILIFAKKEPLTMKRVLPKLLSNDDDNSIELIYRNATKQNFRLTIYEDLPDQLQDFKWERSLFLDSLTTQQLVYTVHPKVRGVYEWYNNHVILRTKIFGLIGRKLTFDAYDEVQCFPSFHQFNKLKISALVSSYTQMDGTHVRKLGQSMEFEQIKKYATGDDFRHINWKASAKQGRLMLNQFQDERSQQIYCVLDMGRAMLQPFDGTSLIDYSINATLGLTKAIIDVKDKVGLINFYHNHCEMLKPKSGNSQFRKVNELLYNCESSELESSFELLYKYSRNRIKQRSLLIIFTHFDNEDAIERNLPYLKAMSKYHLLLIVIFKNTELMTYIEDSAASMDEIYTKTIAQSVLNHQEVMARELNKIGISTLITEPKKLSMGVINKYLEIKRKQMI